MAMEDVARCSPTWVCRLLVLGNRAQVCGCAHRHGTSQAEAVGSPGLSLSRQAAGQGQRLQYLLPFQRFSLPPFSFVVAGDFLGEMLQSF